MLSNDSKEWENPASLVCGREGPGASLFPASASRPNGACRRMNESTILLIALKLVSESTSSTAVC